MEVSYSDWGFPMSEPQYLSGDSFALSNGGDAEISVDCDCGWSGEVNAFEEYAHGYVSVYAEWKCPNCDENHTSDYSYDPREDEDYE